MNKLLLKSVREYKKQSILTPIFAGGAVRSYDPHGNGKDH